MARRHHDIAALYMSERDRLARQISRSVGSHATASDLVQDVFLRLWEKATSWNGNPSAFLTRCVRNAAIDHIRAEKVRRDFLIGVVPEQYSAPQPTPFEALSARQNILSIDDALAALPRQTRHIFLLNRIHGRTFNEIAGVIGITERAVAKHMAKAMAACEAALADSPL